MLTPRPLAARDCVRFSLGLLAAAAVSLGAGCASQDHQGHAGHDHAAHMKSMAAMTVAVAVVRPASASNVKGLVRFERVGPETLRVTGRIEGLTPNGAHGFHVHEFGDASAADASSAGSHFDPDGTGHHGGPKDAKRHGGDMGNLQANAQGVAEIDLTIEGVTIAGPVDGVLGRSVIIHAKADDFGQPLGNAGGRIGVGVIGLGKAPEKK